MTAERYIDLNADAGEFPLGTHDETEAALFSAVTTVNLACGGHAGDRETMAAAIAFAERTSVAIAAHPSFPDRDGFGRRSMSMSPSALTATVRTQIEELARLAEGRIVAVKPHGALYHAADNASIAEAIAEASVIDGRSLPIVSRAGSAAAGHWRSLGRRVLAEGFADRGVRDDGSLMARGSVGAVIDNPKMAGERAVKLARTGEVDTICVHSDTRGAAVLARTVAEALREAGFVLRAVDAE